MNISAYSTRCKKRTVHFMFAGALVIMGLAAMTYKAYASVTWNPQPPGHDSFHEAPSYGEFDWDPYYQNNTIAWIQRNIWDSNHANNINANRSFTYPKFEMEAYNPGAGTNCDQLSVVAVWTYSIPQNNSYPSNECGGSTAEQGNIWLATSGTQFQANRSYQTGVNLVKRVSASGEVNFSFQQSNQDSWLGKIYYNSSFNSTSSQPAGVCNYCR